MKKKRRLKTKYKVFLLSILGITATLLWSRYISTSGLIIREYKVINDKLPASFNGLKVVHFTDTHYGRTINNKEFKHLVDEINALKPDLIFFTGDLIDRNTVISEKIKNELIKHLSKLKASMGKYAVNGNHDLEFDEYNEILNKSDFINLSNTYDVVYSKKYEPIYIAGLESEIKGNADIKAVTEPLKTKEGKNNAKYRILLLHTPDTLKKINNNTFNLVLAGHSHNGQVRLPFIGSIITPNGAKKYYNEYYKIDKTDLYISGGVGTSTINFRFFNKPSFNFYRIVNK